MALLATYRVRAGCVLVRPHLNAFAYRLECSSTLPSEAAVAGTERRGRGFGTGANARSPETRKVEDTHPMNSGDASYPAWIDDVQGRYLKVVRPHAAASQRATWGAGVAATV
jgi:hypothetical protein